MLSVVEGRKGGRQVPGAAYAKSRMRNCVSDRLQETKNIGHCHGHFREYYSLRKTLEF